MKSLKFLSVLSLFTVLLISAFSSNSWAMNEEDETQKLAPEMKCRIVQLIYRRNPALPIPLKEQPKEYHRSVDWKTLATLRLTSRDWKDAVDNVMHNHVVHNFEDRDDSWHYNPSCTLRIRLSQQNYDKESLSAMAPFVYGISLNGSDWWDETAIPHIGTAMITNNFCNVRHLSYDVRKSFVDDKGIILLAGAFKRLPKLKGCSLYGDIGEEGMEALTAAFSDLSHLQKLIISGNFGDTNGRHLGKSLHNLSSLIVLDITSDMSLTDTQEFAKGLPHLKNLQSLCLSWTKQGDPGCVAIVNELSSLHQLDSFSILASHVIGGGNLKDITDEVRQQCVEILKKHPNSAHLLYKF